MILPHIYMHTPLLQISASVTVSPTSYTDLHIVTSRSRKYDGDVHVGVRNHDDGWLGSASCVHHFPSILISYIHK